MRHVGIPRARLLLATGAWVAAVALCLGPTATPAVADGGTSSGSAVSVSGTGPFAALKVTVSQTNGLIDQVVRLSWTGGKQTQTGFSADYLQFMQCWGDDPSGPTRDHCEFGGSGDTRGGPQVTTRQLDAGPGFVDPAETQTPSVDNPYNYVPFEAATWVDDPMSPGHEIHPIVPGDRADIGQFFDAQSTNELSLNATGADGTGEAYLETMTAQEAPGLGCGATSTDASGKPWTPHCWLVAVPRGETEVTGAPFSDNGAGLVSTPLSASNWANRIVVPLTFAPIGLSCPLGSPEQGMSGQESALEAVHRWQAQLCKDSGTVYSFAKISDEAARRRLVSTSPGLAFVSKPVPPTTAGSAAVVYAPVAVSAGVIAFNIDYSAYGANNLRPLAGQRVPSINLTPRLVAKLITQSYLQGAPPGDPALATSHALQGLTYDPDFAQANPGLAGLNNGGGDVLMPFTPSDLTEQLWRWIDSDPDARAFLDGTPDPWGMTVNPSYLHITDSALPSSFPKQDSYCAPQDLVLGTQPPALCSLDDRPYANDMHDAARSAARGDSLSRSTWDPSPPQPHYKKGPPQISGQQYTMAFTDAATAARYSLPVAHLENAAGDFPAPDAAGLAAAVADMVASPVAGVLQPDLRTTDPAAYPLTSLAYAATSPGALSVSARSAYADFIRYAATTGQTTGTDIGQLPFGYLPLTPALVTQAVADAQQIRNYVAPPPTTPPPSAAATTLRNAPSPTSGAPATSKPKPKPKPQSATPKPSPHASAPSVGTPPVTNPVTLLPPPRVPIGAGATPPAPAGLTPTSTSEAGTPTPTPDAVVSQFPTSAQASGAAPLAGVGASLQPVAEIRPTPSVKAGNGRYVFAVILAVGGLSALSGPTLLRLGRRRPA